MVATTKVTARRSIPTTSNLGFRVRLRPRTRDSSHTHLAHVQSLGVALYSTHFLQVHAALSSTYTVYIGGKYDQPVYFPKDVSFLYSYAWTNFSVDDGIAMQTRCKNI